MHTDRVGEIESSPHVRGSSLLPQLGRAGRHVLPARAGVIPEVRGADIRAQGPPRTCGGHPSHHGNRSRAYRVLPARAGVIRRLHCSSVRLIRPPRTCGGHPYEVPTPITSAPSSPHVRGSSPEQPPVGVEVAVLPARAGVIPPRSGCSSTTRRPPRTCGGHPSFAVAPLYATVSSLHVRGSSPCRQGRDSPPTVLPARAGVILWRILVPSVPLCPPRTCGGHPETRMLSRNRRKSSPHVRGSSHHYPGHRVTRIVLPARAGVIRTGARFPGWRSRPPRTCGGHPNGSPALSHAEQSSPHVRGSSPAVTATLTPGTVLPARAGVILTTDGLTPVSCVLPARAGVIRPGSTIDLRSSRPPRTCGGHPTSSVSSSGQPVSSPHVRGSSQCNCRLLKLVNVLPARAGVIPGW